MLLPLLALGYALAAPRIAVVDLQNKTGDTALDGAGAGVSGILVSKLTNVDTLEVVERERLDAVLDELDLGQSGLIDPATAAKAGKLLGASHLVMGDIASVKLPTVAITLRIVEVGSGKVVAASDVVGQIGSEGEEFFVLVDQVAMAVIDSLQVKLGAKDRIELSQVQAERFDTVSLYGSALRAIDTGDRARAQALLAKALALEPGFALANDALKHLAQQITASRSEMAAAAVERVHAGWDAIERATAGELPAAPTPADLANAAIRARMRLIRGDPEGYLKLETARLARTILAAAAAEAAAAEAASGTSQYNIRKNKSDTQNNRRGSFDAQVSNLRTESGALHVSLKGLPLEASDIQKQMTLALLSLGRRDEATVMLTEALGSPPPWDIAGQYELAYEARQLGLYDLEVRSLTIAARALGALPAGDQPTAPMPTPTDPGDIGRALVSVMLADGKTDPSERLALEDARTQLGAPPLSATDRRVWAPEDLLKRRAPPPSLTFAEPASLREALIGLARSDGTLAPAELDLIQGYDNMSQFEFGEHIMKQSDEERLRYRYTAAGALREVDEAVGRLEKDRADRASLGALHDSLRDPKPDLSVSVLLHKDYEIHSLIHESGNRLGGSHLRIDYIDTSSTGKPLRYLTGMGGDPMLPMSAHEAFLARARGGLYENLDRDSYMAIVRHWAVSAMLPWNDPWYADQKVAAWMTTMDLLPPTDDAERVARDKEIRALIEVVYGQ